MMVLRALLIDHDEEGRRELKRLLEEQHIECCEASGLVDALRFASPHGIDIIISDAATLRVGALSLQALLESGAFGDASPPLIVSFDPFEAADALAEGIPRIAIRIAKPFDRDNLLQVLERAFGPSSQTGPIGQT